MAIGFVIIGGMGGMLAAGLTLLAGAGGWAALLAYAVAGSGGLVLAALHWAGLPA